jgi:hypothetical protein
MNYSAQIARDGNLLAKAPRTPKQKKRLPRVSKKRRVDSALYAKKRKAFLEAHPWCQIFLKRNLISEDEVHATAFEMGDRGVVRGRHPRDGFSLYTVGLLPVSTDIHHTKGRTGENYLNTDTWLSASRKEHEWVHSNPKEARTLGLLSND